LILEWGIARGLKGLPGELTVDAGPGGKSPRRWRREPVRLRELTPAESWP
jgi:hypothetical protein